MYNFLWEISEPWEHRDQEKCGVIKVDIIRLQIHFFINEINIFSHNIKETSVWSTRFYGNEPSNLGR